MTLSQSSLLSWLYNVAVGYQGLSVRCESHRQQVSNRLRIETGLPKDPARCAVEVPTVSYKQIKVLHESGGVREIL